MYIYVCVYMEPFKSKSKILKDSRRFQQLLNHYAATGRTGRWRSAATLLGDLAWLGNPLEDLEVEVFHGKI